jgi:hypothetical protein
MRHVKATPLQGFELRVATAATQLGVTKENGNIFGYHHLPVFTARIR